MVNDLLDLAQIEAGRIVVRPAAFTAVDLFGALRGMFRALAPVETRGLVFDDPVDLPPLHTDEGKLSQILRNFIANALKFTERGEVRVARRRRSRRTGRVRGGRHRHRHRAGGPGADLRGVLAARERRSSARPRAPGWGCRCRASWPSCWAGTSPSRARSAWAPRSA